MAHAERIDNSKEWTMRDMVCRQLQAHGYTLELNGYRQLVATKTFDSIVGKKMAYVELTGFVGESVTLFLTGVMVSEGQNCLASCGAYIAKPVTELAVAQGVAKFSAEVEKTVANLTIVRLLKSEAAAESAGVVL